MDALDIDVDLVTLCNLVTVFRETKIVTNSRLHCTNYICIIISKKLGLGMLVA